MNPTKLAEEIEGRYRRYLKTTFYFRDPDLRASFEEALSSGHLSKGPYLEATPVFKRGQTSRDLFRSLLGFEPDKGFLKAAQEDRPLYQHQEEAIQRVFRGRNVIVATGTGSGKTEAFLYPILLHLYREFQAGELCPSVRALILYPMNALANDQRERLGEICKRLEEEKSPFQFTFGQYIGETPKDENDSQRHARDHIANRLPGELVLRSDMRCTPPHILLTNYSMLEYLLLRPDDSPLFDNGQAQWWTFLVLDEAHQYRGSRGIEMAMLLRRLKQRLREGGRSQPFRCIATSATLLGGEKDKATVAKFASDLFDEGFDEDDVITGTTVPIPEPEPESLSPEDYELLRRATNLRRLITGKPADVREVAAQIFDDLPDEQQISALSELVEILLRATDPISNTPLLSARYHLFLRSLEGAFVSYYPQKKVFLERKAADEESTAFEVALCRECGQHYFVGKVKNDKLTEAIRDPSQSDFGATFFRPIADTEDEDEEDESNNTSRGQVFHLCVQCGEVRRDKPKCGHNNSIRVIKEAPPNDEDRADQIARCSACGYNAAGRDPVQEVVHGTDGPHAVIATTLYQTLPEERKKVLAFADGRQEAAFFAWYLEDSYRGILNRNLLLKVARRLSPHTSQGLSLRELATGLRDMFNEKRILPPATGDLELRREAWLRLYREFLTDEPRISLEGVGLVRWSLKCPDWFKTPEVLTNPPWSLTEPEARDLTTLLLNSMRTDRAVELRTENGVPLSWSDLGLQATQMRFRVGDPRGQHGVRSWDGKGRRARLLAKLLMGIRGNLTEQDAIVEAVKALRAVWETIIRCDESASSHDHLLLSVDDARRLNPDWWRLRLIADDDALFQCDTCSRLQAISIRGVCPRHRCPGTLKEVRPKDLEINHYRLLYEEDLPGSFRVEEHTAQLDNEKAREFQREFKKGNIHVLSCSTTFELGVDLGDLDTVFLRNVPPEAFNYAQRVGRAGRRSGHPGFAITYCRRGPHDLYHFSEPGRMLNGMVRPPALSIQNEKIIIRHIAATALSRFFRAFPERFNTVANLFTDLERPSCVADFQTFLHEHRAELEESLHAIVPPGMVDHVGLTDGGWMNEIAGDESRLALAEAEISSDYRTVRDLRKTSFEKGDDRTVAWAGARAKTIAGEEVLSFLSRKAVIPKYGFPVDVVELDTQRTQAGQEAREVSLQRDLAIAVAEFAPTSKLVANKKIWTSYGLKKVAEKEWDRWWYARCPTHNRFERRRWQGESQRPPFEKCCERMVITQYLDPKFGFITNREKPEDPKRRPARVFTTRPYFAGFKDREGDRLDFGVISLTTVSPGYMVVLCEGRRGRGFYVCRQCGAGFREFTKELQKGHKTPHGENCSVRPESLRPDVSLGHEFVTDVLQIQFQPQLEGPMEPVWFAYSLAYALVEGAAAEEVLGVPSTDLNATVAYSSQDYSIPPIVLYDNVPGGAGLVARLEEKEVLQACLDTALKRVSGNCDCDESTSCYGCLRSYRNQFAHQHLQRGPVMHYLEALLSQWK
ncbi:MAG: DEAD/DEAH box helicase [Acidobacteria bacterium]|nr:DEAD/DEAH box helicase [Acidobacteriota bacterium]